MKFNKKILSLLAFTLSLVIFGNSEMNKIHAEEPFTVLDDSYFNSEIRYRQGVPIHIVSLKEEMLPLPKGNIKIPYIINGYETPELERDLFKNQGLDGYVELEDGIKIVGVETFANNNIKGVIMNTVETVDYGAFAYNDITEVYAPSVKSIDIIGFGYNNLQEAHFDSLERIEGWAFRDNNNLSHIHVNNVPQYIDENAFVVTGPLASLGNHFNIIAAHDSRENVVVESGNYIINGNPDTFEESLLEGLEDDEDYIYPPSNKESFEIGKGLKDNSLWFCADEQTSFGTGGKYKIYEDVKIVYVINHGVNQNRQELIFDEVPSNYLYAYNTEILASAMEVLKEYNLNPNIKSDIIWMLTSNLDLVNKEMLNKENILELLQNTQDYRILSNRIGMSTINDIIHKIKTYKFNDTQVDFAVYQGDTEESIGIKQTLFRSYVIPYSQNTETIDLMINKEWFTKNSEGVYVAPEFVVPDIKFKIYADGEELSLPEESVTLKSGEASLAIERLPKFLNDGITEIVYTVEELVIEGYDSEKIQDSKYEYTFKNYNNVTIDITATKIWENAEGKTPEVSFQLYRNGVQYLEPQQLINDTYTWYGLAKFDEKGEVYIYTVDEINVPDGYVKEILRDGLTIKNIKTDKPNEPNKPTVPNTVNPGTPKTGINNSVVMLLNTILISILLIISLTRKNYKKYIEDKIK